MNPERSLSANQQISLSALVKRRLKGEPMAYILGYKDFYGLRFKVNKNVLIPRPETEFITEQVADSVERRAMSGEIIRILDMGTGSGCIAISLAKQLQSLHVKFQMTAADISGKALVVAKQNAKAHKTKIKFIKSDLFENVKGKFDIVVGNLPYVPASHIPLLFKERWSGAIPDRGGKPWEPLTALTDGTNDYIIYEHFFQQVSKNLNLKSLIYLEIDPGAKPVLTKRVKKYLPGSKFVFHKDFNRLWRFMQIKI